MRRNKINSRINSDSNRRSPVLPPYLFPPYFPVFTLLSCFHPTFLFSNSLLYEKIVQKSDSIAEPTLKYTEIYKNLTRLKICHMELVKLVLQNIMINYDQDYDQQY